MLEVFALRDRERKAVVTGTTAVLFSYHSYPYLFENPIKTYESKLLAIYFFNFCTVCIFYVTVQMICLICFCPILKKPFSFFFVLPSPKLCCLKTSLQPLLLSLCYCCLHKALVMALLQRAKLQRTNLKEKPTFFGSGSLFRCWTSFI